MAEINLPFKVDHIVEVKSFENGYRGAWFRCKIVEIFKKREKLHYSLEYLDFPEEKIHETKVVQRFRGEDYVMVRPPYPPRYHESELLEIKGDQEPLVVVHGSWKVRDSVDLWQDDCYWTGTVVELKENEAAQVELLPPPHGEGKNYDALCKDLRPSLEWSPRDGWKLPSVVGKKRQCAKLVKREKEDVCENGKEQTVSAKKQKTERAMQQLKGNGGDLRLDQVTVDVCENAKEQTVSAKKQKTERAMQPLKGNGGDLPLNIMESESIEAPLYDLEELIARIEWLKEMLSTDVSEGSKSHWKYEDYRPSSSSGM